MDMNSTQTTIGDAAHQDNQAIRSAHTYTNDLSDPRFGRLPQRLMLLCRTLFPLLPTG